MTQLSVYVDPIAVTDSAKKPDAAAIEATSARLKAAIVASGTYFRWEDVRRVFYATQFDGETSRSLTVCAHVSLKDGRFVRIAAEFALDDRVLRADVHLWTLQDWDAFVADLRTWTDPMDHDGRLNAHVELCGTVLDFD